MSAAFSARPELLGDLGMVASTHWLASAVGMSVLERGGNAADAAVAAGFVLQVVEPHLNGPGGEAPILLWDPAQEQVCVVAGQGVMPAGATLAHFADLGLDLVPGTGLLPAAVPGAVGAWLLLLEQWGTWELREVLEPAISYAERGYPALPGTSDTLAAVEPMFRADWPSSARTWLGNGVPAASSRLRNPVLGQTWRRLLTQGEAVGRDRAGRIEAAREAFYSGFVAEAVEAHCRRAFRDTSGEPHAGLLTGQDLAGWRCPVEDPVTLDYHGYTVCKTGPWGQGPVFLQQLALLAGDDLGAAGLLSADYIHTVVECAKLAFADREAWYGDPAAVDVPLADLLSSSYAEERRTLVGAQASTQLRPGSPGSRAPRLAGLPLRLTAGAAGTGTGEPTVAANGRTRGDTVHLDVIDRHGLTISATPSGGGCRARRPSKPWASASGPAGRWPGWSRTCRRPCVRVPVPGRRCRRHWFCARGGRTWPSGPPAVTSRTSGRWPSSSPTCTSGWACRPRSRRPPSTAHTCRARSGRGCLLPPAWSQRTASPRRCWPSCADGGTT